MQTVSASDARQTLPAQLDRVEGGEEVAITRHGRVVAVLVSPAALAARRAPEAWQLADKVGELLERARRAPVRHPAIAADRADALADGVRTDRAAR